MSSLSLSLLGPFEATLGDQPLSNFRANKVQALLIYMATEATVTHRREALMDLLWPGLPLKSAQVNLRQTLYRLRQIIPEVDAKSGQSTVPLLLTDRHTVELNPDADIWFDVARFTDLLTQDPTPAHLEQATALYRGDFSCDFYLPDSAEFEDWVAARRSRLRHQALAALDALTTFYIEQHAYDQAQAVAWRALEIDDLRESAYRGLMTALALDGQRGAALAQYRLCRQRLWDELGIEPADETNALYERIQVDALRESQTRIPRPVALPAQMPVFIFTDIENSTPLWETHREAMLPALLDHNRILEEQIAWHGGRILEFRGDGVRAVFEGGDPLTCAVAIQQQFGQHNWGAIGELRIRIGLHAVPIEQQGYDFFLQDHQYYGPALHHAARIMDAGWGGQILASAEVHNSFPLPPGATWKDFGRHLLKGVEKPQRIYGLLHPGLPRQQFPALRTLSTPARRAAPSPQPGAAVRPRPRHNLPSQPTPFFGREEELADLDRLINDPAIRLVTILGPGGMGKTRLALACAERHVAQSTNPEGTSVSQFPNGVYFVPLARLSSADHIVPAIAEALGFRLEQRQGQASGNENGARTRQLLDYLRRKRMLLILDNFEHLLGDTDAKTGADLVADIVQTAPRVQVLVTSRERLFLYEEQVYTIQGLAFPDGATGTAEITLEDAANSAAAQLFVQTALRAQHDFELRADDIPHLAHICRLVDGMPLGIEISASWVDMLTLADIAREIRRSLDFLETEWRDIPSRHRSMRAVFDATFRRLSQAEQDAFVQLTVFRGGFTRQAARGVLPTCDAPGTTLRTLAALVDKSLLRYDKASGRYEMHELLRQYGGAKLATDPELEAAVLDRHSRFYCSALQAWEADLKGARQLAILPEMEVEIENLRVAWEREVAQRRLTCLDRTINGLCHFNWRLFRYDEGEAACRLVVEMLTNEIARSVLAEMSTPATVAASEPGETSTETLRVLSKALAWQSFFMQLSGRGVATKPLLERSLDLLSDPSLARQETRWERAFLLWVMGHGAVPDWPEARRLHEQSLTLFQVLGDEWWTSCALRALGRANERCGDLDQARRMYQESLALNQALGDPWATAYALEDLSRLAKQSGDYEEAKRRLEQGLALSHAQGHQWSAARLLIRRAWLALMQGEFEAGADFLRRASTIHQEIGDRYALAQTLTHLGTVHSLSGRFAEACALMEQGLELAGEVGDRASMAWIPSELGEVNALAGNYREAHNLAQMAFSVARHAFDPREITARFYRVLGWTALVEQAYAEAQEWLEKSVKIYRTVEHYLAKEWMTFSLAALGRAACGLGDLEAAQSHLVEGLRIALDMKNFIPLLFVMPIISLFVADRGQKERAVELYALAASQPLVSKSPLFEAIAGRHIAAVVAHSEDMPPEVIQAAQARGRARDMWATATELLEELTAADD